MVSVMIAPPSRLPSWRPKIVVTGSSPLRSAWRRNTTGSDNPFARAVRTKSADSASSTDARTSRVRIADMPRPSVIAGNTRLEAESAPGAGRRAEPHREDQYQERSEEEVRNRRADQGETGSGGIRPATAMARGE